MMQSTALNDGGYGTTGSSSNRASSLLASLTGEEPPPPPPAVAAPPPPPPPASAPPPAPTTTHESSAVGSGSTSTAAAAPAAAPSNNMSSSVLTSTARSELFGTAVEDAVDDGEEEEEEADLFGKIPAPTSSSISSGVRSGGGGSKLLSSSGLLGTASGGGGASSGGGGGGGGGLFDEVDAAEERERLRREAEEERERQRIAAEEERLRAEAAEKMRRMEEERARQEEEARRKREQEEAQQQAQARAQQQAEAAAAQQQQQQAMMMGSAQGQMHDLSLGGDPMQQQQQQGQMPPFQSQQPQQQPMGGGFYRPDPLNDMNSMLPQQQQQFAQQQQQQPVNAGYGGSSYYYTTSGSTTLQPPVSASNVVQPPLANQMRGRYADPQVPSVQQQQRRQPSITAGLHNGPIGANFGGGGNTTATRGLPTNVGGEAPKSDPSASLKPPAPFLPLFGKVIISDPMLVQAAGLFAGPPHWTYKLTITYERGMEPSVVQRRFRHFVALEDRLRNDCPGAILPPRPDKHQTRAIEEASSQQSAQFAAQRANELQVYINSLVRHPIAGKSDVLRLFLTLQDHIGTAWPEVSANAITRLGAVGAGAAVKVAEGTSNVAMHLGTSAQEVGEDNAELLALASSEGLRIGAVTQAVPKVEGAITLLREQGERCAIVGMEMNKLSKDVQQSDRELSVPLEILSSGLLRGGRRTKRLAVELSAAAAPFVIQYKLCRYERMAFADRRNALAKRQQARGKADGRARKLMVHQSSLQSMGKVGQLERMEMEAAVSDENAAEAVRECDEIGITLKNEVARVTTIRRSEWSKSMKVVASCMKESCSERAAIWESALASFKGEFPDFAAQAAAGNPTGVATAPTGVSVAAAPGGGMMTG